jgi:hypothetical protein
VCDHSERRGAGEEVLQVTCDDINTFYRRMRRELEHRTERKLLESDLRRVNREIDDSTGPCLPLRSHRKRLQEHLREISF